MSTLGRTLFGGSPFIRWTLGPVALVSLVAMELLRGDESGKRLAIFVATEVGLVLLALVAFAPVRCAWAGRTLAGLVFLAYLTYLVAMLTTPDSSAYNSILGLLFIGYPAFTYAVLGRFSWKARREKPSAPL